MSTDNDGEGYDNTNRGVLFTNDKRGNERAPDFNGSINVEGKEFRLAAWAKTARSGKPYWSLSVSEPRDEYDQTPQPQQQRQPVTPDVVVEDIGDQPINLDDIPF